MNRSDIQRPIRFRSDNLNLSARQIETIQTMLGNGLTFSYYLNWNSITYYSQDRQRKEEERMLTERLLALPTQQTDTSLSKCRYLLDRSGSGLVRLKKD